MGGRRRMAMKCASFNEVSRPKLPRPEDTHMAAAGQGAPVEVL